MPVTHEKNKNDNDRQNITYIKARPLGEFYAFSRVGFSDKIIPSPSVFACAEEKIEKTSDRKKVVRDNKVFKILDRTSCTERLNIAKDVESKDTR